MPLHADEACKRTSFMTAGYKDACQRGGQKAAKDYAKRFLKEAQKKQAGLTCQSCHTSLAPNYAIKTDALSRYQSFGGVLLSLPPANPPAPTGKPQKQKPSSAEIKKSKTGDDCIEKKKEPPRAGQGCSIN
ncbi:MAG: hypothetical protein K8S54_15070 [Spirochaetia bacterium]|nr:hypothetical protein [Spirochaetia bacterium]